MYGDNRPEHDIPGQNANGENVEVDVASLFVGGPLLFGRSAGSAPVLSVNQQ